MDGLYIGKPILKMDDLGGKTPYFRKHKEIKVHGVPWHPLPTGPTGPTPLRLSASIYAIGSIRRLMNFPYRKKIS